jgi:parallel beta-helix repeat protein
LFVFAFNVQTVRAQGAIYINPDGSISPSTAPISTVDNTTYTLTGNIIDSAKASIVIQRNNILIDGSGYTIEGSDIGIICWVHTFNVTIKNTIVKAHVQGVNLYPSSNCTVSGNEIIILGGNVTNWGPAPPVPVGVVMGSSSNCIVSGNDINSTGAEGIVDDGGSHNTISGNSITNSSYGVYCYSSFNDAVSGNDITLTGFGVVLGSSNYTVISRNNVTANSGVGILLLSSCSNIISGNIMSGNNIKNSGFFGTQPEFFYNLTESARFFGIYLFEYCNYNTISGNRFTGGGLFVFLSFHNVVVNNSVNGKSLVYLEDVSDRTVSDAGQVVLIGCDSMIVDNLNLSNATIGVELWQTNTTIITNSNIANDYEGVSLNGASSNIISGNNMTNNGYGVLLNGASSNIISGNNMTNNAYGVFFHFPYYQPNNNNRFFHNNLINNTQQVSSIGFPNIWDNGFPSGGNYWSDYQTGYPGASEIDGSGIWNTPYVIAANNTDYYPLMTPWTRVEARVTPVGKNVTNTYATGAVVTFSNVTSSGVTTLTAIQPPSTALTAAPNSVFINFQTNATYYGNVTLQFKYDPAGLTLADQMAMRIWLWNTTSHAWRDITTRVNTTTDTVYGVSPHLSCFGMTCTLSSISNGQPIQTTVQTPSAPPPGLPASLEALAYYNITATTQYTKPVTIQLVYNSSAITQQQAMFLQMWLWNTTSAEWVPIPTRVDTVDCMVIGVSPHLSCFGMTSLHSFPEGIAVPSAACSKTVVGRGYNITISVQLQNQGNSAQNFTAYVYANGTAVYSEQVSNLPPKGNKTVTFNFTANLAYGNYSISACDQPIKWVRVTIPGDLNGDGTVDLTDFGILQEAWPPYPPGRWDPRADINGDGVVDLSDFGIMQMNWGLSIP